MSLIQSYEDNKVMTPTERRERRQGAVSARRSMRMKATALFLGATVAVSAGPKALEVVGDGVQTAGAAVAHFGGRALDAQSRMDSEARASDRSHYSDEHPNASTGEFSQMGSAPEAAHKADEAAAHRAAQQIAEQAKQQQPLPDDPNIHVK